MADRYWVGGTGNWNTTASWSTASGGSSGASVPTSADNVFFDNNSAVGTFTVTIDTASAACANFNASGITNAARKMTLTGTASVGILSVNGSWTNPATSFFGWTTWAGTQALTFTGTGTLTTNSVAIAVNTLLNSSGGTITLGGQTTFSGAFGIGNGSFDTSAANNYTLTFSSTAAFGLTISANSNTRDLNLNASSVSLAGTACWTDNSTGGFTLNAGTSTITFSNASPTFAGGGKTFYNVTFSSTTQAGIVTINGANTFNNISFSAPGTTGYRNAVLGANQTVQGTLTLSSGSAIRRQYLRSDTIGTQRIITMSGASSSVAALSDVDFRDVVFATASGSAVSLPLSGTRLGDNLNNSQITFDAAKTVYWNLAGSQNWSATAWATTNTGTPAVNNFPLSQDTAVFTEAGSAGTVTIDAAWSIGTIQMADGVSNRSTAFTLTTTVAPTIYGSVTFFANLVVSGTSVWTFSGQGKTVQINTAGVTLTQPITINAPTGTVALAANVTLGSTLTTTLTQGTLDLNDKTLSTGIFSSSNSNTRSVTFGTGNITLTGNNTTIFTTSTSTGMTWTGTPVVNCTYSGSTGTRTISPFIAGPPTGYAPWSFVISAGTDIITTGAGTAYFQNIDFTGFAGTLSNRPLVFYGNVTISTGMTLTAGALGWFFYGTSGTQVFITNGKTLDFSITQDSLGATLQLQDNLTMGSTRTFTHTGGTLDLSTKTATIGTFSSTGSTARAINFNSGTLSISGTTTSAFTASGSNLTTTGTGTITMTAATAKTFAGGGFGYTATLNQGGAGALTISGSNTFYNITATTLPSTITFTSGTTQTVTQFTASGTAGNLLTLNSTSAGSPFTLRQTGGTVNVSYVSITDSTATGGATWNSYLTNGNVDGGGNTGWNFTVGPATYSYSSDIKLRSMAQRGRF